MDKKVKRSDSERGQRRRSKCGADPKKYYTPPAHNGSVKFILCLSSTGFWAGGAKFTGKGRVFPLESSVKNNCRFFLPNSYRSRVMRTSSTQYFSILSNYPVLNHSVACKPWPDFSTPKVALATSFNFKRNPKAFFISSNMSNCGSLIKSPL